MWQIYIYTISILCTFLSGSATLPGGRRRGSVDQSQRGPGSRGGWVGRSSWSASAGPASRWPAGGWSIPVGWLRTQPNPDFIFVAIESKQIRMRWEKTEIKTAMLWHIDHRLQILINSFYRLVYIISPESFKKSPIFSFTRRNDKNCSDKSVSLLLIFDNLSLY